MPRAPVKGINPQVLPPEVPVQWVGVTSRILTRPWAIVKLNSENG